ncbi:hypothetical protein ASPZODRAFT_55162 [Penicilliopsis zonata CBS 506.65]|uniref:N-acetyltransferase domain-containing protein n=1 Tax=Penicilliopsis zonata CBS 506.65 TaxID=1073090 RepID=A0A1L9SVK6_9EURO|nr:hypothetical protein ASPZODRAFT_55162 [Penicilliopsis zonata CBS 506.65]OJJ51174.1 hypothetical protein ASPZODRAFT_55162 [Penicilliopsis zonata CBS 506.65]
MIASSLPPGDSPRLVLVPATPAERLECTKLNSVAWKGPLDLESYIAREDHLLAQQLTGDGQTCWILVDGTQPAGARTILGACESYKKKALLAYAGQVEDIATHGVGSVYCRPEFRGKGYANRMIQELSVKLETWQLEEERRTRSVFSVLFSDIGKKFYAQHGWKPFPSSHIALPSLGGSDEEDGAAAGLPSARDLSAEDVKESMCSDAVFRKARESLRAASERTPHQAKIAIAPDYDHFVWHWAREEFYAEKLFPHSGPPLVKGAGEDRARVYCAWTRVFGETPEENTLYILRWIYDEPASPAQAQMTAQAMAAVLRRAQRQAHKWDMRHVEFWNPTPLMLQAVALLDPDAKVVHREKSSIASLKWDGAKQGLGNEVEWVWNEKYAWC